MMVNKSGLFKKALVLIVCILMPFMALAQSGLAIKATFVDSASGDPLSYATASITRVGAKDPSKYVLTDIDGKAVIEKVRPGSYVLKVELLGYKTFTKEISFKDNLDLGVVKVDPDTKVLDAASVSAAGNPIIIKKDTIEYNASSFKTTENDMLEDLLKKLPGVEVGEDGSITANGESVKKIMIDGKTFFLDDPQLASKNIPSKIIEKVKVVAKKSEQAAFTGIDDGEEETVIDLSVHKGMMNGLMGNMAGGLGRDVTEGENDLRYQMNGFVGQFNNKSQFSVIFNGNNTNNRGFNDLAGGMMQGMRGGGGGMGRGMGGWGQSNGITKSWMGGVNGARYFFDDHLQAEGNYLYNGTNKYITEESDKLTYLDGYDLHYSTKGESTTNTDGHRIGARLDHKFSDKTSVLFMPSFNIGSGDFSEYSNYATETLRNGAVNPTNDGFSLSNGDNKNWSASGYALLRQRLGIPGRTLTFNLNYNFSNNDINGLNQSYTNITGESTDIVNQRYENNQKNSSVNGRLTYTEPLGKGFYVEANYSIGYNKSKSVKDTWDSGSGYQIIDNDYLNTGIMNVIGYQKSGETVNETYSNNILNRYINQTAGLNFMYQDGKLHAQVGFSARPTDTHNETNGKIYDSKVVNWAPTAMMWYDINDNTNVRVFYRGSSSQPSTNKLMPVPDNTDPLNVSFGNPYLQPYFNHNVRSEFSISNKKTFFSFRANIDGSLTQDPIVNASWYGTNGARYSIPVNGHNSGNIGMRFFLNSPIAKSNFTVSNMSNIRYNSSSSYVGSTFDTDKYYQDGIFDYELFHKDFADLDDHDEFSLNKLRSLSVTERIRLTYRNDIVELTASGRTNVSKSWNIKNDVTNMTATVNNQVSGSMNWTLPCGLGVVADVNYNWYNGYSTAQEDETILNATLSKLLFKKTMTLAVKAYDILNQSKNLSISDNDNFHMETRNNTLGRYVIFSLTYRFGTFGGRNGRGGGMRGGPMGGPSGGHMGPPRF